MSSRRVQEIRHWINIRPLTDAEGQELLDEVDELNLQLDALTRERDEAKGSIVDARESVDQAIIEHTNLAAELERTQEQRDKWYELATARKTTVAMLRDVLMRIPNHKAYTEIVQVLAETAPKEKI